MKLQLRLFDQLTDDDVEMPSKASKSIEGMCSQLEHPPKLIFLRIEGQLTALRKSAQGLLVLLVLDGGQGICGINCVNLVCSYCS